MSYEIREGAIDASEVIRAVSHSSAGGVTTFLGVVRGDSGGRRVLGLEYQAYASMAAREMERIAIEITREIPGVRLAAVHRVGALNVGDVAIACAASAPHREEAFVACRRWIDRIKAEVPIWKRETYEDGAAWVNWVDARCSH